MAIERARKLGDCRPRLADVEAQMPPESRPMTAVILAELIAEGRVRYGEFDQRCLIDVRELRRPRRCH